MGKIIDVSKWQGAIDWKKAAGEVDMAILRASCARAKDERLDEYAAGCKANGIPFGVYHYLWNLDHARVRQEADVFYAAAAKHAPRFWIVDLEEATTMAAQWSKDKEVVRKALDVFAARLRELGASRIGIYTWERWGKLLPDSRYKWAIRWYATWGKNDGTVSAEPSAGSCQLHQYTSNGKCAGISGRVDLNRLFGGAKLSDLIGTAAPPPVQVPDPPADPPASEADEKVDANKDGKIVRVTEPKTWYVRTGPGAEYPDMGTAAQGNEYEYIGVAWNGWLCVLYDGKLGWISPNGAKVVIV